MTDTITKEHRSWNMGRIRSKDTKPELIVRSMLHGMGYRFRLNGRISKKTWAKGILPGKPDIVLAGRKTVIFVHGCFWHRHRGCKGATTPKTRTEWWIEKLNANVRRDQAYKKTLEENGWKVIVIWECELTRLLLPNLEARLSGELKNRSAS
jgi:DNA mismatch endonuclease (patch repair protein)